MSAIKNIYFEYGILIVSGFLYTFSFSPVDFKVGIFLSLSLFLYILSTSTKKSSLLKSFVYGIIVYSSGVSWVFNSIYYYGGEHLFLSSIITMLFIILLSIFFIPLGYFVNKEIRLNKFFAPILVASIWVLIEFIRANIFGGFPWLLVGVSQTGTMFDYIFPLLGSFMVSFIVVMLSMMLVVTLLSETKQIIFKIYTLSILILYISTSFFSYISIDANKPLKITIVQPNINLGIKFNQNELDDIKKKYVEILDNKINDLVILPETAIPRIYQLDKDFYDQLRKERDLNIISGVFNYNRDTDEIHNSIVVLNDKEVFYNKRHLVPFGEYTPFKNIFGFIGDILNIPMSDLTPGNINQTEIKYDNIVLHPLVCYEIAYPSLIRISEDYSLIINVSNDAWFGDSLAPYQHLQISQARALEASRPVIRAANTGISAIIDKNGTIVNKINLNQEGYINANIYPSNGITPYMYFGDYPILMLIFSIMLLYWKYNKNYG